MKDINQVEYFLVSKKRFYQSEAHKELFKGNYCVVVTGIKITLSKREKINGSIYYTAISSIDFTTSESKISKWLHKNLIN